MTPDTPEIPNKQQRGELLQKSLRAQHMVQDAADRVRRALLLLDPEQNSEVDRAFITAMDGIDQVRIKLAPLLQALREAG